jgi:ubiquinone/menaquinone biosynthesis C-methylase UbiE
VRDANDEHTQRLADVYSSHAQGYAELWSPVIRPVAVRLLEMLPWAGATRVLDVGTGAGGYVADLRRLAGSASVVGIDRSAGMLALAREHTHSLAVMDAMALGVQDQCIDIAVMAFVLFHLNDPVAALVEVHRVLRPGGAVGVTTWAEDPEVEASRVWEAELDAHGAVDPTPLPASRHETMNTPDKVEALFSAAGLQPSTSWREHIVHQWDIERLTALRMRFGHTKRKLESLDPAVRAAFLARARERISRLEPKDFLYRAQTVSAVAYRPIAE